MNLFLTYTDTPSEILNICLKKREDGYLYFVERIGFWYSWQHSLTPTTSSTTRNAVLLRLFN